MARNMTSENGSRPGALARLDQGVTVLAKGLALAGGLVLIALIVLTSMSIAGRYLIPFGFGPVPGDFERVDMGGAFAVFCFLPWCQLRRGHVSVDLIKPILSARVNAALDLVAACGMALVAIILTWRLGLGLADKFRYGETTLILQVPVWWGYAASLVGAAGFAVVCIHTAIFSLFGAIRGQVADHKGLPAA